MLLLGATPSPRYAQFVCSRCSMILGVTKDPKILREFSQPTFPPAGAQVGYTSIMRYDFIVIGSGFGGSVSALRLVERATASSF